MTEEICAEGEERKRMTVTPLPSTFTSHIFDGSFVKL